MTIKKIKLDNNVTRWEVYMRLPFNSDKKIRRRFDRKIDAQEFLDKMRMRFKFETDHSNTLVKDVEETTFNEEADYWLEKKSDDFTEGYMRVITCGLKRLRSFCGHQKVARLTPSLLFELRSYLKSDGLSVATQNRYIDLVVRVVNFSYQQKRINVNPTLGYQKLRERSDGMLFWTEEEVSKFLTFVNNKYPHGSDKRWIFCLYALALETGMRARELWGLRVFDLPKVQTKLKVSWQLGSRNTFEPTKGKDSRYVPLSSSLRRELEASLRTCEDDSRTVFVSSKETPINHDNFAKRVFKKDVLEAGVTLIRFHDLRHTALTLMVKKNISLPVVQKIAGHKKVKTTMRYVHVVAKDIEEVGQKSSLLLQFQGCKSS